MIGLCCSHLYSWICSTLTEFRICDVVTVCSICSLSGLVTLRPSANPLELSTSRTLPRKTIKYRFSRGFELQLKQPVRCIVSCSLSINNSPRESDLNQNCHYKESKSFDFLFEISINIAKNY